MNRLQEEIHEDGTSVLYSYDEVGNRTRKFVTKNMITATAGSGGRISPSGTVAVRYGKDQGFVIEPTAPNYISDVLIDGVSVGPVSSYTFTNVITSHTIDALFMDCAFRMNPASQTYSQNGGVGNIGVSISSGCSWTAESNSPWLTINSGGSGTGNGNISYSVDASTAGIRVGTITVGGNPFTVEQRFQGVGELDTAFNAPRGINTYNGAANGNDWANAVAIQPDGKIVAVGNSYDESGSTSSVLMMRYMPDGSLDGTFGTNGAVTYRGGRSSDYGGSVAIQADGKLVIAGSRGDGTSSSILLLRFNADGALDSTFGTSGSVTYKGDKPWNDGYNMVALQADGKIVVAGYSYDDTSSEALLLRYNPDGTLDNSFGTGGTATYGDANNGVAANGVAVQPDGKVVVVGVSYPYGGTTNSLLVLRYNVDGTLDDTFGTNGYSTYRDNNPWDSGFGVAIQPDGKIVAVGVGSGVSAGSPIILRYKTDGTLDNTFGTDGYATYMDVNPWASGYGVAIQADGKIVVVGGSTGAITGSALVLRYNPDGTLDNTFGMNGSLTYNDTVGGSTYGNGVAIQQDGKAVIVGERVEGSSDDLLIFRIGGMNDTTPPAVTIDPAVSPTNQNSQRLGGTMEAGATVNVSCPTATVGAVSYPTAATWTAMITNMQEGNNIVAVTATDLAGNVSNNNLTATIVVDTIAPVVTITATPEGLTNSGTATFSFTSDTGESTFKCLIDNGVYAECASPVN